MGLFSQPADPALLFRLARVERKLDALLAHLQVPVEGDDFDDIRALIAEGRKIEAMKLYRERTGAGLAEAKDAVDRGL
ncbi:MAG: hypothetical protein AB7K52_07910 [Phycisphaerales bacterium]